MTKTAKKMDPKRLKHYQKLLMTLKEKILDDVKKITSDTSGSSKDEGDVSGHALHMADVATDMYDKEFSLGLASGEREILQRIDNALKRIDDGTYGVCIVTGKPIKKARLDAIPYVETCLEAQEELDKKNERLR